MLIYYLMIIATAIPEHWLLSKPVGGLTITKWIGMAGLLAAVACLPQRRSMGRSGRAILLAFFTYFTVMMVSCLLRGWTALGWEFTKLLSILSLFVVTYVMVDSEEKFRRALVALMISMAFASNYVIRQFFQYYGVYKDARTGGPAGDPNYYAAMIVIWLPPCLVLLASTPGLARRFLYLGCIGASLVGFILAGSRGGLVGIVAACLFLALRSQRRIQWLLLMTILFVPPLILLPSSPIQRMLNPTHGDVRSQKSRITLWKSAWQLWQDNPVLGVGTVGFKEKLQQYQDPEAKLQFTAVHNTYLECMATWGLVGLVPSVAVPILAFRALGKVARRRPATFLTRMAVAFQASIVGYSAAIIFLSAWWLIMYYFLIFLSVLLIRLADLELPQTEESGVPLYGVNRAGGQRPALAQFQRGV